MIGDNRRACTGGRLGGASTGCLPESAFAEGAGSESSSSDLCLPHAASAARATHVTGSLMVVLYLPQTLAPTRAFLAAAGQYPKASGRRASRATLAAWRHS